MIRYRINWKYVQLTLKLGTIIIIKTARESQQLFKYHSLMVT